MPVVGSLPTPGLQRHDFALQDHRTLTCRRLMPIRLSMLTLIGHVCLKP